MKITIHKLPTFLVLAVLIVSPSARAQEASAPAEDDQSATAPEGILPVPDYTGDWTERPALTGDWGGLRQKWAENGFTFALDWYQVYQDVVDGGIEEGGEFSTNLDYRMGFDLMRMGLVPGAVLSVRAQSRWGDTVNGNSGVLLPVNAYSAFPSSSDVDGDVDIAVTELNWLQFLSEQVGVVLGKITTMGNSNEFMGGEGRTQFMNFQFMFSPVLAQLAPYSTLAAGVVWMPSERVTVGSNLLNTTDSSTTSGFDDIGDGATWATTVEYLASLNDLPGGGTIGFYYGFDGDFAGIGGINIPPGGAVTVEEEETAWALSWSGWQYLTAEDGGATVDPRNGRQDLQGLGVFLQLGLGDEDTNPVSWSVGVGLAGRGTIPGRDNDTWGIGYFYNDLQDLDLGAIVELDDNTQGLEIYYDIHLIEALSITLDAQWMESGLSDVDEATILAARMNVSI
jgi:porin